MENLFKNFLTFLLLWLVPSCSIALGDFLHIAPESFLMVNLFVLTLFGFLVNFIQLIKFPEKKKAVPKKEEPKEPKIYTESQFKKYRVAVAKYIYSNHSYVDNLVTGHTKPDNVLDAIIQQNVKNP